MNKILIIILRLFSSCPGIFKISGKVISGKTEEPVEGAKIELIDVDKMGQTDSFFFSDNNGNFSANSIMRRMLFGLPTYQMRITKSGYQTFEIILNLESKNQSNLYKLIKN